MSDHYKKSVVNDYGIVHFFQFETSAEKMTVIPDGSVDMIFCCSEASYAYVKGTVYRPEQAGFDAGKQYFGVRFLPGFNPILGENVMDKLIDRKIPFEELVDDERMLNSIYTAESFRDRIDAFMRYYMSIYQRIMPMDKSNLIVRHSLNMIFNRRGNITVEELADETGYSTRHINQCFRDETAMSPKQFIKIIRFQSALDRLHSNEKKPLSEIASSAGYYDQAHFIREFREYTGFTPNKYRLFLEENDYSSRIEIT